MLGSLSDVSKLITTVIPSTLFGFLIFIFFSLQYFLPVRSLLLRVGASVFCGGVAANVFDRIRFGFVVDFLILNFGRWSTAVFNFADAFQWVGVILILMGYLLNEKILYPEDQKRNRLWIKPDFQKRYCMILISSGSAFAVVSCLMSYSFLTVTVRNIAGVTPIVIREIILGYLQIFFSMSLTFFLMLTFIGIRLSHRIAGPLAGFEAYIDGMIQGQNSRFQVRQHDELKELNSVADKFYKLMYEDCRMDPKAIEVGSYIPELGISTIENIDIDRSYLGKVPVWLMIYRYATCPLCATHLASIEDLIARAKSSGIAVIAVYESKKEDFFKSECPGTMNLLKKLKIPLVSDPERRVYRKLKAKTNIWALLHWSNVRTFIEAKRAGLLAPTSVDGSIGQLPVQFLIKKNGEISFVYYGVHFNDFPDPSVIESFISKSQSSA